MQAIGLRIAAVGQIDRAGLGGRPIQPFALIETGNASIGHPAGRWIKSQMQAKGPTARTFEPAGVDDADRPRRGVGNARFAGLASARQNVGAQGR